MNAEYPTAKVAATPGYVLELLRDVFHDARGLGEWPTTETTVSDLALEVSDLIDSWPELVPWLNDFTQLDLPEVEWAPTLEPMDYRTVGEMCRFVADRMGTRPVIRPWPHVDGECLPAGAFLTARALLVQLGADAGAVTPSAPLRGYLLRFGPGWVFDLARMAPGRLPPVDGGRALQSWSFACVLAANALMLLGLAIRGAGGFVCFVCFVLLTAAFVLGVASGTLPSRIALGDLNTFRDLAYALAGQEPRRQIQPSA